MLPEFSQLQHAIKMQLLLPQTEFDGLECGDDADMPAFRWLEN
jgi:hypothetical protein